MTSRRDREDIARLNGAAPHEKPPWKKPPTLISVPSNNHSTQAMFSGRNPYHANPNRKVKNSFPSGSSVGNVTSSRTLVGPSDARPEKRRRVEEPYTRLSHSAPRSGLSNGNQRTPHPEPICISDDEEHTTANKVPNRRQRLSSDDLNVIARPSSSTNHSRKANQIAEDRRRPLSRPLLAPDTPEEEWLENNYVEGGLESDRIESFSDSDVVPRPGAVKAAVKQWEGRGKANDTPPKIDLAQKQRARHKMKGKQVVPTTFPRNAAPTTPHPTIDSFMTSSTLSKSENKCLPVKAYYAGRILHADPGQELEFPLKLAQSLTIKSGNSSNFNLFIKKGDGDPPILKWTKHDGILRQDFAICLKSQGQVVTIKFDTESPSWSEQTFDQLRTALAHLKPGEATTGRLWESAENRAIEGTSATSLPATVQKNSRVQQLEEIRQRKDRDGYSLNGPRKRKEPGSPLIGTSKTTEEIPESRDPSAASKRRNIEKSAEPSILRRSSRNSAPAKLVPAAADQDEVILVYPPGTPGAVNITNADLARLEPGEFLNDTLIEFGLKLWLKKLEQEQPDLASQIHVFNSFFYKKLNQKDPQQGYESVKKWTSKIDIFKKKYIVVPINEHLHWYLAIIYEPEHVLSPGIPEIPPVRKETRSSKKGEAAAKQAEGTTSDSPNTRDDQNPTPSEVEVEHNLNDDFQNSCTIESPGSLGTDELLLRSEGADIDDDDGRSSAGLSYVSGDPDEGASAPTNDPSTSRSSVEGTGRQNSVEFIPPVPEEVPDSTEESEVPKPSTGVAPSHFYGKRSKGKGKEKAVHDVDVHMEDVKPDDDEVIFVEHPKTYIFTMDSLGTRHPQAIKRLVGYLKMEALDKKGVEDGSTAVGKFASVPVQPNFCDCGVYLLHFAQTFMLRPQDYCQSILAQKPKSMTNKDRQEAWEDHKVAGMRDQMAEEIKKLSAEWKKARAANAEAKKTEQPEGQVDVTMADSDTDVELVETVRLPKQGKSARRK